MPEFRNPFFGPFASYEDRQKNTARLNSWLDAGLDYLLGPTGVPDRLRSLNTLLNPVDQMHEAGGQTVVAFDPTRPTHERMQAALNAGIGTITAAAPAIGGAIAGQPARQAVMETLANVTGPLDDKATRFIADETGSVPLGRADPVTQRGDEILSLLSSGRANEVTDAMLDLGDPVANTRLNQYLFNNYDLPMDEASRMARAGEMGFDTDTPLYHGTAADFPSFSRDGAEMNFGANQAELGYFLTNSPRYAGQYTEPPWNGFPTGPNIQPNYVRGQIRRFEGGMIDDIEANWTPDQAADWRQGVQDGGVGGVSFGPVRYEGKTPVNEVAIFDPANIRSRFARFDPRLAHLSNLNASLGGLTLGGLLGLQGYQDDQWRERAGLLGM